MTRSDTLPPACLAARPLIDAYLVDELGDDDSGRLAGHLRGCAACSAELGGATRLVGLLATLPDPEPLPDLDERIILAAIADRRRRHEHRSWLADLRVQVLRGAMRTTGTLVATIVTVALLGGAFVFAAAGIIAQTTQNLPPSGTVGPEVTPTLAPTHEQTAVPTAPALGGNPTPVVVTVTPSPAPEQSIEPSPTPAPTPAPSPAPSDTASPSPTPSAEPSPSASPSDSPSPSPTDKPKRTPVPSTGPSASPTPSPSAASTTSP